MDIRTGDKTKILVVDDEIEICSLLREYFEMEGFATDVAYNGQEAILKSETFQPECILMNIQMPTMGGFEAMKIIRKKFPRIRVLMFTGEDQTDLSRDCLSFGASAFINKPAEFKFLKSKINEALAEVA